MKKLMILSLALLVGCDSGTSSNESPQNTEQHIWYGISYHSFKGDTTSTKRSDTLTVRGNEGSFSSGHKLKNVFYVNKKWYGQLISWGDVPANDVFIATENSSFDYMISAKCTLYTDMVFYFNGSQ